MMNEWNVALRCHIRNTEAMFPLRLAGQLAGDIAEFAVFLVAYAYRGQPIGERK
jgi:hypothetical protein